MGLDGITSAAAAAAEAARAAAEAARRAAEEAARKAAEEARRAASEAAKQAAQSAAAAEARSEMNDAATKMAQDGNFAAAKMMRMEAQDASYGEAPWEAEDRAAMPEAAKKLEQGVSFADVQKDPQLAKDVAALKDNPDPKVRALAEGAANAWVKEALNSAIANGKGQDPKAVFDQFKADVAAVGNGNALGEMMSKNADMAVRDAAVALLESKPSMQELTDNPAKGQLLATLQKDGQYKDQVAKLVQGYAQERIDKHLDGKEKESGAKKAADETTADMLAFAKATGLAEATREGTNDAFQASKDKFEDTAKKGRSLLDKAKGLAGDFFGAIGDVLGAGLDKLGDLAEAGLDVAGDVAQGGMNIAALGLDAVGAEGVADDARALGAGANTVLDKSGQIANDGLDVAGAAIADGPEGVANLAMQGVLGDEKPEYKGEMDGVTGAITNRLGKGDSVYVGISGSATVGVVGYGEVGIGAEAQLSRNSDGTISLTLEGEVSAAAGVGVETGAEVGMTAGETTMGAGATADASAEVNAKQSARLELKFDPRNPADAARLKALIEPDAAAIAAAATNPAALLAVKGPALAEAVAHNKNAITISGQVGVAAEANAGANAGVGPASLEATVGAKANAVVGGSQTFNADGSTATTVFMNAGASASIGLSAGPASIEAGAGVKAAMGMTIQRDASGKITGVSTEHGVNASVNAGAGIDGGSVKGKGGHGETSKVKESLTEKGMAEFNRQMAQGKNPIEAYTEARKVPDGISETKSTTTTDEFSIGGGGKVALAGVKVGLSGRLTVGKSHTDEERLSGPSVQDNNLNQDITNF